MGLEIVLSRTVLITGANGFIGSALINRLLQENVRLSAAVMDECDARHLPAEVKRLIVRPLSENSDYTADLKGIDVVVHLAARVHIMHDTAMDPLQEFRRVNLHGTERLARQAALSGVKRFVFISTVKVLGEETASSYREDTPLDPHDPYGISKAEAESALWRIAGETGLEVVVVRPPLVYGPGVKSNFLRLLETMQRGIPLPLKSIDNQRSLIYIENLVDALACCATHPNAAGQTYLVSDGEDVSTPVLLQRVASALGKKALLFPFPQGLLQLAGRLSGKSVAVERLVGSLQVDSSKIRNDLGWSPPFTMEEGLRETADWFKNNFIL
jgi:nucleoside-diphosphate-sugar epimerase